MIYSRSSPSKWAMAILNRLQANNYHLHMDALESWEVQTELFIFTTIDGAIYGLWFYAKDEKDRFCQLVNDIKNEKIANILPKPRSQEQSKQPDSQLHSKQNNNSQQHSKHHIIRQQHSKHNNVRQQQNNSIQQHLEQIKEHAKQDIPQQFKNPDHQQSPNILTMLHEASLKSKKTTCNCCQRLHVALQNDNVVANSLQDYARALIVAIRKDPTLVDEMYNDYCLRNH